MRRIKVIALAMTLIMLQPLLMSCAANKEKGTTVKEDDPWFESYRFELETDQKSTEMLESSIVSYSNGRLYHLYSLTNLADYENYRRTMLTTYDESGTLLNRVKVKEPAGYSLNRIISLKPDDEGKKAEAVAEVFAPGAFYTAVIQLDLESGNVSNTRMLSKENNEPLEISLGGKDSVGVSEVFIAGEYYLPVIYAGNTGDVAAHVFAFKGAEYLCELDLTGIPNVFQLEEFSYDQVNHTVMTVGYTMTDGAVVLEFDPETGRRIRYEKYDAGSNDEVNLADYKAVTGGELCKIDSLGNITTFDMQTRQVRTAVDNNWYTPYFSDLSYEEVKLVTCDSDTVVIYSGKETDYSLFFTGMDETVTILKKADKNPNAGKKVIEIATPVDRDISEYLSNAVFEFNKTDNEYLIRVWSKYKTGIKAGRDLSVLNMDDEKLYTMIQELNGSEAPDIAIGIQKNYAMRDEVFEDLTGYLDQSVTDMQFANIIEASRIGGKQYFLPVTLEIEGLVTDTSLIKNGAVGITFEEFEKMTGNDLDGFSPYDYPFSEYYYKKDFVLSCIDTKAAIEGSSVDFGTDQFRAAVEYSNEHFVRDGYTKPEEQDWDEEFKRTRGACRYDKIGSFTDFVHSCKDDKASYTIIGTPSVDASGPRFRALETISVTASSDRKDGARKFINFLFAGAGYENSQREFQNLVTNKSVMEHNIRLITEKNNLSHQNDVDMSELMMGLDDYSASLGYKFATEDMGSKMIESLSTISTYYYDDPVITAFLVEELSPYYAGDRTLDESVKILNDRANKYIKEM